MTCILLLLLTSACKATPASTPTPQNGSVTRDVAPDQSETPDTQVREALVQIEEGGGDIRIFTATLAIERIEPLFNKREVRTGDVIYERAGKNTRPRFAVHMEKRLIGRRLETRPKHIVFDGRWLTEVDEEKRQVIRYELCGEEVDPTSLGGRFPLPVGQPADEVLQRYDVELIKGEISSDFLKPVTVGRELVGLRISHRPGVVTADDFEHIDLWYDTTTWLPLAVEVVDEKKNIRRIRLSEERVNPELDDSERARLKLEYASDGDWVIDERPCASVDDEMG